MPNRADTGRHDLRSGVADEGDCDDEPRDAARGARRARAGPSDTQMDSASGAGHDREDVTVRALLTHSSGLTRVASVFSRLHRAPGISARHCVAAARVSARHTVDLQRSGIHAARLHRRGRGRTSFRLASGGDAGAADVRRRCMFNPPAALRPSIAPTENDPWRGRRLVGEVHDENCWALGGAAGHAGLFGTAEGGRRFCAGDARRARRA